MILIKPVKYVMGAVLAQQVVRKFSKQKDYKLQFLVNVMKARLMSVCWKNDALALVFTIKCA